MPFSLRCAALALAATSLLTLPAHAANYGITESRVQEIVEDYISKNPELLLESIRNWQEAQQREQRVVQSEMVKERQAEIFNAPHSPSVGPADAPLVIAEFFDYNCPACKSFFATLQGVMKKNPGKIRVIFKEFPIFGETSEQNAAIALAVHQLAPEKYFAWHEKMMTHRGKADMALALAAADEVGLNSADVMARTEHPDVAAALQADITLARELKVPGTPAIVIGDKLIPSALPAAELQMLLDEIEKAKAAMQKGAAQ